MRDRVLKHNLQKISINLGLLLLGALLFALSFPNFLYSPGFGPLGFFALIPVFLLIKRIKGWASPLWGALYGYVTYSLFNFWLAGFNPVSFLIVPFVYASWFLLFFPLLWLADRAFPRWGWLAQLVIWGLYEGLRTKGFLGYSYGILGYSQYYFKSFIGISDIFGVAMVSLLTVIPSLLAAHYLADQVWGKGKLRRWRPSRRWLLPGLIWGVLFLGANAYGLASRVRYDQAPRWRVGLVQHNVNAWLQGMESYRQSLDALLKVSDEALAQKPEVLIWPETAFVPAIEWHEKYRQERGKAELIKELKDYFEPLDIPIIIGNNDSVKEGGKKTDYNAALLFDKDKIVQKYRKIRLVPFSEHFPYGERFPGLLRYIQDQGTPFYKEGTQYTIFDLSPWGGPQAAPLICFEDTFGYLAQNFVKNGAEVLVNISNDAWSTQPACALQHGTIAMFRAVENRRSLVRATTGGLTTIIDPNGKPLETLELFTRQALVGEVPLYTERTTLYTRWGPWWERITMALGALAALASGMGFFLQRRRGRRKKQSTEN